jgi:hypothetical protein
MGRHVRRHATVALLVLSAILLPAGPSFAAVGFGGGADLYAGPEGQTNKDLLGFLSAGGAGGMVTGILSRYDSSNLGPGVTGSVVVGLPLTGGSFVQFAGIRSVGDEIYRAWRFAFGPVIALGAGRSLGIVLSHTEENVGSKLTTITSEYSVPLSRSVGGVARGSFSSVEGGGTAYQGVLGMTWAASKRFQAYGELGLGRDVVTSIQTDGTLEPSFGSAEGVTTYLSGASITTGLRYTLR